MSTLSQHKTISVNFPVAAAAIMFPGSVRDGLAAGATNANDVWLGGVVIRAIRFENGATKSSVSIYDYRDSTARAIKGGATGVTRTINSGTADDEMTLVEVSGGNVPHRKKFLVTITGATPSAINGTRVATRVDDTHFLLPVATTANPSAGTVAFELQAHGLVSAAATVAGARNGYDLNGAVGLWSEVYSTGALPGAFVATNRVHGFEIPASGLCMLGDMNVRCAAGCAISISNTPGANGFSVEYEPIILGAQRKLAASRFDETGSTRA